MDGPHSVAPKSRSESGGPHSSGTAAGLLAEAFSAIPELGDRLDRVVRALEDRASADAVRAAVEGGLHPDHAYSSAEAARFLGIAPASVPKVSRQLLPRVRSGRFLGIDILAYRGDITARDAEAYKRATRERVRTAASERPAARSGGRR